MSTELEAAVAALYAWGAATPPRPPPSPPSARTEAPDAKAPAPEPKKSEFLYAQRLRDIAAKLHGVAGAAGDGAAAEGGSDRRILVSEKAFRKMVRHYEPDLDPSQHMQML